MVLSPSAAFPSLSKRHGARARSNIDSDMKDFSLGDKSCEGAGVNFFVLIWCDVVLDSLILTCSNVNWVVVLLRDIR